MKGNKLQGWMGKNNFFQVMAIHDRAKQTYIAFD